MIPDKKWFARFEKHQAKFVSWNYARDDVDFYIFKKRYL